MTTSGTYQFDPPAGQLIITAFGRIGVRRTELLTSHLEDARMACNLIMSEWSSRQPNLWTVGLTELPLVIDQATYTLDQNIVSITDLYLNNGATDSMLAPMARPDYAALPDKALAGTPNQYWFNKQVIPTITFYPVPTVADTVFFYAVRRNQDVELPVGQTVEVPFRFLEAFVAALAWKLAEIYRPELEAQMMQKAERSYMIAAGNDVEGGPIYISPDMSGYWS